MPARTRESAPDLLAPTEVGAPSPALPTNPEIVQTVASVPSPRQLLPKDLSGALQHLDDAGIDRLLTAVVNEARRRGRLPSRVSTDTPQDDQRSGHRRRAPTTYRSKPTAGSSDGTPSLTQGRINAVRAAFKAGVKPAAIAREFGLSPSAVRQALVASAKV
jgi:hypothetical protein